MRAALVVLYGRRISVNNELSPTSTEPRTLIAPEDDTPAAVIIPEALTDETATADAVSGPVVINDEVIGPTLMPLAVIGPDVRNELAVTSTAVRPPLSVSVVAVMPPTLLTLAPVRPPTADTPLLPTATDTAVMLPAVSEPLTL